MGRNGGADEASEFCVQDSRLFKKDSLLNNIRAAEAGCCGGGS